MFYTQRLVVQRVMANYGALICYGCGILLLPNCVLAQRSHSSDWSALSLTFASRAPILVEPLDTTGRTDEIHRYLARYDDLPWRGMTIEDLADLHGQFIPVYLDRVELDLLGIDPGHRIADDIPQGSLAARLKYQLEQMELTYQVRDGFLIITSQEAADSDPAIRIYDVEEILMYRSNRHYADFDSLIHTLYMHVDPDSWLPAGGTSGITPYSTKQHDYLVVSAPETTQKKVEGLLNALRQKEDPRAVTTRKLRPKPQPAYSPVIQLPRPSFGLPRGKLGG